jgi:hypothetical protein
LKFQIYDKFLKCLLRKDQIFEVFIKKRSNF